MKPGDLAKRFVAHIIDSFALSAIMNILLVPLYCLIFIPMGLLDNVNSRPRAQDALITLWLCFICLAFIAVSLAIAYAYHVWFPVKKWRGATIGKRVMNIRIVRNDGKEVTQTDLFIREFIGKFISAIVFYLGYIWILVDEKNRAWHDIIADTIVIESDEKVL